jgi:hypothetical protein
MQYKIKQYYLEIKKYLRDRSMRGSKVGLIFWRILNILNEQINPGRITFYVRNEISYKEFLKKITDENYNFVLLRYPNLKIKLSHFTPKRSDLDILISDEDYYRLIKRTELITRNPFQGKLILHIKTPTGEIFNTRAYEMPDFPIHLSTVSISSRVKDSNQIFRPSPYFLFLINLIHLIYHKSLTIEDFSNKKYYIVDETRKINDDLKILRKFTTLEVLGYLEDGWVIYLDDDDRFTSKDVVENIVNEINKVDEDTLIYWRMVYSNGRHLPLDMSKNKKPILGGIGGSCFTFNVKYKHLALWDGWKCSDYRVINKLHNNIPKKHWVPKNFIFVPSAGLGNRKDL